MQLKKLSRALAVTLVLSMTMPNMVMAAQDVKATEKQSEAPETEAPATETPQTETQQTEPQATEAPDTEVPVVEIPDTEAPDTEPDETEDPDKDNKDDKGDKDGKKDKDDKKKKDDEDKTKLYVPDEKFTTVVEPEKVEISFRFQKIAKEYALSKAADTKVYGEMKEDAKAVGQLGKNALCFILQKMDATWSYIESGEVRGFVKTESLSTGTLIKKQVMQKGEKTYSTGKTLVKKEDNPAWGFAKVTTQRTVAAKSYAISDTEGLNIREEGNEDARRVGRLSEGALCYVLADAGKEWVFVESGDVRGFVKSEYLLTGDEARKKVKEKGEEKMALAQELIEPEENKACYYTMTSVQKPEESNMEYLGNFTLTAYCSCPVCCGKWSGGMAAGGVYPVQGRTVAMAGVEFGTKLVIDGEIYTVEDRGTPYGHVDIYMVNHLDAAAFGKQTADVYLLKEDEKTKSE